MEKSFPLKAMDAPAELTRRIISRLTLKRRHRVMVDKLYGRFKISSSMRVRLPKAPPSFPVSQ